MRESTRVVRVILALSFSSLTVAPLAAHGAGVSPLFDLSAPDRGPFPSDRFTVPDADQLTGRRVALPLPDCTDAPADCDELRVIDELDGFNLQPRLSIPFTGPIDPNSATSSAIFLVGLGDVVSERGAGEIVGINQVVWDIASNTLHVESDQLLRQHSRYALIVTNGVRDAKGDPIVAGDFASFRHDLNFGQTKDPELKRYRKALLDGIDASGVPPDDVVAASVFTTQSATAILEKIRDQIKAATPPQANFDIASDSGGHVRTAVVDVADLPVEDTTASPPVPRDTGIRWSAQTTTAGALRAMNVPLEEGLGVARSAVARIAWGKYRSWDYEIPEVAAPTAEQCDEKKHPRLAKFIPHVPTRTGVPQSCETDLYFILFVPSSPRPATGWPVAIYTHGTGVSKETAIFAVAGRMALQGIATIGITNVGQGFGPKGVLTVKKKNGEVFTLPSGGRGVDQDGAGAIGPMEGLFAMAPRQIVVNRSDGDRQTAIDLLALVRAIELGIDVDGEHLDAGRIYQFGNSQGGYTGTLLLAVEPSVRAAGINAAGATIVHAGRLGTDRTLISALFSQRRPMPFNAPTGAPSLGMNENIPARGQDPVKNDVEGAMYLQEIFERIEWVNGTGDPQSYAPHIRRDPLDGVPVKDIIFHIMMGDRIVPNPVASELARMADLKDRTTYYRHDLVFPMFDWAEMTALAKAAPNLYTRAKNSHFLLSNLTNPPPDTVSCASPPCPPAPKSAKIAFAYRDMALDQLATFFATDGEVTIDPDGEAAVFETPIRDLPEVAAPAIPDPPAP